MGCGVSKPKIEGEDNQPQDPPGVSPIRRRIEEIKRVRNARIYQKRCKSTLSDKQLLQSDNVGEEEHIPEDSLHDEEDRKSVSFPTERIGSDEANVLKSDDKRDIVRLEKREEVQKKEEEEEDEEEEEEEEEEDQESTFGDGEEESELYPRSPSFRDYCVASVGNSVDSFDTCKDDGNCGEEKREKFRRKESITSLNSSEGSVVVLVKKEHKGRRFRKVLPKGGQVAVKNLLNVKSCYIPSCSNPHGSSHSLLNEKSHTKSS